MYWVRSTFLKSGGSIVVFLRMMSTVPIMVGNCSIRLGTTLNAMRAMGESKRRMTIIAAIGVGKNFLRNSTTGEKAAASIIEIKITRITLTSFKQT